MSGAPKRLHEEGSHSTPLKRPLEDIAMFYSSGKLIHPSGNDFRVPFQTGQDPRLSKIQRTEPRDIDKRSSLPHRTNSSPSNCLDLPITENRSDLRNFKDSKDVKTENREIKADMREFYSDTREDRQDIKVEKDARLDSKEIRPVRDPNNDIKADVKFEKDSYITTNSHTSLKETKEHHRGKKYSEQTTDSLDSWRLTRHEASGENKVDMKDEEKFREKDRKRKEEKHRDFSGRDRDRNNHRSTLQFGGAINEYKEPFGEEKGTERWKRERNDAQKEKEQNDKDSDPNKGEASDANVKDESVRISETETVALQPRLHKDDSLRASDNDLKAGGMDVDEGDIQEKHEKYCDKEVGDECADGDRVTERKRMLRPRGTPQTPQREARFRSRAWDNDGSGQSEVSTVVYKPGVCMQELLKLWREFEPSKDCKNDERSQNGPTLEIRIPAEYVTATNHQVRGAQLWGTDIYTNDSDLVAVLMHTGYCRPTASPPSAIHELLATVQLLPPQDCYISTLRNNVRSRAWGAGIGCSFFVERCCIVKKGGGVVDLEPRLTHISAVEPTLAPVSVERTMTTRAAASNALRQQRFVREVTVQYSLCNEPWLKYSISIVADKGLKKPLYTSARLKKGEVLYLETHRNRYELCFNGEKSVPNCTITSSQVPESDQAKNQSHSVHASNGERNATSRDMVVDVFRWSRCKKPLPQNAMCSVGIPLPVDHLMILEDNVEWEDMQWSQTGVLVAGKEYALARVHFLPQT